MKALWRKRWLARLAVNLTGVAATPPSPQRAKIQKSIWLFAFEKTPHPNPLPSWGEGAFFTNGHAS